MNDPLRVLFVCTANICRSPVMELSARAIADRLALDGAVGSDIEFTSAGTHGFDAAPINPDMATTLPTDLAEGLRDAFRSRPLTPGLLADADLVLTAEASHRSFILEEQPQLHRQVFTLGQFAAAVAAIPDLTGRELVEAARTRRPPPRPADDIADPYRRGTAAAERATGTITSMLNEVVPRLVGAHA